MQNKDVIERRYLQLKLNRDRRTPSVCKQSTSSYIAYLKAWLKHSVKRTKRAGGLGR